MYAHKVLESYFYMLEKTGCSLHDIINHPIYRVKESVKYHFDDIESIRDMTAREVALFSGEYGRDLRLPFKTCWFDYVKENKKKVGALLTEIGEGTVHIEVYLTIPECTIGKRDLFVPNPYEVFVGLDNETHAFIESINRIAGKDYKVFQRKINENIYLSWGKSDQGDAEEPKEYYDEMIQEIKNINACMLLLSCKNIKAESVPPVEKLNKKRRKKGKQDIMDYKTLRLVLPRQQRYANSGGSGEGSQQATRLHLCAGHFKSYTQDAPLFGKHTGRFWWQPHVRGDKDVGQVNKEYAVSSSKG
jgi:hypothetical protein